MEIVANMLVKATELAMIAESHSVLDEFNYEYLTFYANHGDYGDVEKAQRDLTKLIPVQRIVTRHGTVFQETVYIDPNKDSKKLHYSNLNQHTKSVSAPKYTGTTRVDTHDFKRGDRVTFTLGNGNLAEGEFRHIAVSKKRPEGVAVLRANVNGVMKTYGRNLEDISHKSARKYEQENTFDRRAETQDFSIGDRVSMSLRTKTAGADGSSMEEVHGTVTRFFKETAKGQLAHIRLDNGKIVERYLHNVVRYDEKATHSITHDQEIALNKSINRLCTSNEDTRNLIDLYKKKGKIDDPKREAHISKLKGEMLENNDKIFLYLEVLKGKVQFDALPLKSQKDIISDSTHQAYAEQPTLDEIGPSVSTISEPTESAEAIEAARKRGIISNLQSQLTNISRNLKLANTRYTGYQAEVETYRAKKQFQNTMKELIQFKFQNEIPLTLEEKEFFDNPLEPLVKPIAPVEAVAEVEPSAKLRTMTTISSNVKEKKKEGIRAKKEEELVALVNKVKKLGLREQTEEKVLDMYNKKLGAVQNQKTGITDKKLSPERILADIQKIHHGQTPSGFEINRRISESSITDSEKNSLRTKFSEAIKHGNSLRKQNINAKEANQAKQLITKSLANLFNNGKEV